MSEPMDEYEKQKLLEESDARVRARLNAEPVFWPVFIFGLFVMYPMSWGVSYFAWQSSAPGATDFQLSGWAYLYWPLLLNLGVASFWWLMSKREQNR